MASIVLPHPQWLRVRHGHQAPRRDKFFVLVECGEDTRLPGDRVWCRGFGWDAIELLCIKLAIDHGRFTNRAHIRGEKAEDARMSTEPTAS